MNNKNKHIFENHTKEQVNFPDNITIETITNLKEFKTFYKIPFNIYNKNPYWVPPFWTELNEFFKNKNPFWSHSKCKLFTAKKNSKYIGRIVAIIDDKYYEKFNKKIGLFGFFECINDYGCAEALFQSAQKWLVLKNMDIIRGPINGRIDVGCGFLANNYDSIPSLLCSYSPEYYISFMEKFNMKKIREFNSYKIDLSKPFPAKIKEESQKCIESGIRIRKLNRLRTQKELKWWTKLVLETYVDHWGYVSVTEEEVKSRFGVKQLRWFVDPKLFLIAEYENTPVGYIWSTPDYNQIFKTMNGRLGILQMLTFLLKQKQIKIGKLQFIGVKKEFRDKNIGSCLNYKTLVEMKKRGFISAVVGLIDKKNEVPNATIVKTGAKPYKRYLVYEKKINN
jgi:ribosomal protein S18 acetylase RimI-like enzyme